MPKNCASLNKWNKRIRRFSKKTHCLPRTNNNSQFKILRMRMKLSLIMLLSQKITTILTYSTSINQSMTMTMVLILTMAMMHKMSTKSVDLLRSQKTVQIGGVQFNKLRKNKNQIGSKVNLSIKENENKLLIIKVLKSTNLNKTMTTKLTLKSDMTLVIVS